MLNQRRPQTQNALTGNVINHFRRFPEFDLSVVTQKETPLTQKRVRNPNVREAFVNRYCEVFEQYVTWKITLQRKL